VFIQVAADFAGREPDSIAFMFEVRRYGPDGLAALRATGEQATLSIVSRRTTDRFSIVPLSLVSSVHELSKWRAPAGTYKVALVTDSLYQLCRYPCTLPDTIKLTPFAKVKRIF
jgi:hypothetical protein